MKRRRFVLMSDTEVAFALVCTVIVCLILAGCESRPVLKEPNAQAAEQPINTPEAAAELQRKHGR